MYVDEYVNDLFFEICEKSWAKTVIKIVKSQATPHYIYNAYSYEC